MIEMKLDELERLAKKDLELAREKEFFAEAFTGKKYKDITDEEMRRLFEAI